MLEVENQFVAASGLLWHLGKRLPGLHVLAKKSWALTDDFEAYFTYKERLFVMQTPFVNIWVSLLGQPADESIFCEVEKEVQNYGLYLSLLPIIAWVRFCFLPANPSHEVLGRYGALPTKQAEQTGNAL